MQAIKQRYNNVVLAWRAIQQYCIQEGTGPYFNVSPDPLLVEPQYTGTKTIQVESSSSWTASLTAHTVISGTVTASPLSGSAGISNITITFNNAKGDWYIHITSTGTTKSIWITAD